MLQDSHVSETRLAGHLSFLMLVQLRFDAVLEKWEVELTPAMKACLKVYHAAVAAAGAGSGGGGAAGR